MELLPDPTPEEAIRCPGPWEHRYVAANGARFHAAVMGPADGPAVLLVHGFPLYWFTWRHLLPQLAEAGYRAIAMDLRGYGGTDHTPRGYDPFTLAADLRGVIRSLGHQQAVIVGQGWGAFVAWSAAATQPDLLNGLVPISFPHPVRMREAIVRDPEQRRVSKYAFGFQLPRSPERKLLADDAAEVGRFLHEWSGRTGWPDEVSETYFRRAFQYRATAHCALEYHRWAIRSIPRPDGVRYLHRMEQPITVPVLQVQGLADGAVLPRSVNGSEDFVVGPYLRADLPDIGHFPQEEDPGLFADQLLPWLAEHVPPTPRPAMRANPISGPPANTR